MVQVANPYLEHCSSHRATGLVGSCVLAEKIERLISLLNQCGPIDSAQLRALSFSGIPSDCKGLRALIWKVLLGYLPADTRRWEDSLRHFRAQYEDFVREFYARRRFASFTEASLEGETGSELFDSDRFLWQEIRKDIDRTCPDLQFFFLPSDLKPECVSRSRLWLGSASTDYTDNSSDYSQSLVVTCGIERHADVMMRILFVYGRLNPGIRYVQGMNELLAPIYYLFAHDPNPKFAGSVEADTFFCFSLLMSEIKELFVKPLDDTTVGIHARINLIHSMLRHHDGTVHAHLERLGIPPNFFCLRWVTLLLTQDFKMSEVLALWDAVLADSKRFEFFNYVCVAMIVTSKAKILGKDFGGTLKELQRVRHKRIDDVLRIAKDMRAADRLDKIHWSL